MEKERMPLPKLYELALQDKQHQEDRRDTINSYYISLFAAIIAALPFIYKINESYAQHEFYIIKLSMVVLSLICLVLSATWLSNLKQILLYLQSSGEFLIALEEKQDMTFIKFVTKQSGYENAPEKITHTQFILPYTFMLIFFAISAHLLREIFL